MPLDTSILNIYGYKITRIHGRKPLVYEARYIGKVNFPFCKSDDLRKKARFVRKLNHETIGLRRTELHLTARKYHCLSCKRYFNQRFPGILKYKRSTEAFRAEVFERHRNGHTQSYLSKSLGIGTATVERWFHDYLERKVAETKNTPCPRVIGIDEHFFIRKKGYATTICDLATEEMIFLFCSATIVALWNYWDRI